MVTPDQWFIGIKMGFALKHPFSTSKVEYAPVVSGSTPKRFLITNTGKSKTLLQSKAEIGSPAYFLYDIISQNLIFLFISCTLEVCDVTETDVGEYSVAASNHFGHVISSATLRSEHQDEVKNATLLQPQAR